MTEVNKTVIRQTTMRNKIEQIVENNGGSLLIDELMLLMAVKSVEAIMLQVKVGESITGALGELGFEEATANEALKEWANKP